MSQIAGSPDRPSFATLVAYGTGAWPLSALGIGMFMYLPTVYAEESSIGMAELGLVLLIARIWDVLLDPLIGWLNDRTQTRFGRRRPWMVGGWVFMSIGLYAVCLPPTGVGWTYLLFWSIVLFTSATCMLLAYSSWGAELSADYHDRSRIFAARHVFTAIGTLMAAGLLKAADPALPQSAPTQMVGVLAVLILIATPISLIIMIWRVREPVSYTVPSKNVDWRKGVELIAANRPFRYLGAAYLLNGIGNALTATLIFFFVEHIIQTPSIIGWVMLLYFGCAIVGTPIWLFLAKRIGKHKSWAVALISAALILSVVPTIDAGDQAIFFLFAALSGVTLSADLMLPGAMQADVVDHDLIHSGRRRTGVYFALWHMMAKVGLALAVGIAFPILDWSGFDPNQTNESSSLLVLMALFGLVPLGLKLAAAAVIWHYPLTEARHIEIRAAIDPALSRN